MREDIKYSNKVHGRTRGQETLTAPALCGGGSENAQPGRRGGPRGVEVSAQLCAGSTEPCAEGPVTVTGLAPLRPRPSLQQRRAPFRVLPVTPRRRCGPRGPRRRGGAYISLGHPSPLHGPLDAALHHSHPTPTAGVSPTPALCLSPAPTLLRLSCSPSLLAHAPATPAGLLPPAVSPSPQLRAGHAAGAPQRPVLDGIVDELQVGGGAPARGPRAQGPVPSCRQRAAVPGLPETQGTLTLPPQPRQLQDNLVRTDNGF